MGSFYNRAFIKDDEVWVTIKDHRNIPFVGKGPINNPIRISKDNYKVLQALGYTVVKLSNVELIRKPLSRFYGDSTLVDNKIDKEQIEVKIEESKEEVVEEPIEVEKVEESVQEQPKEVKVEEPKEEVVEESVEVEEQVASIEETTVDKDKTEDPVTQEENSIEEEKYDIDNMTKDQLKLLLDAAGVPYKYKNTVEELRELVRNNVEII